MPIIGGGIGFVGLRRGDRSVQLIGEQFVKKMHDEVLCLALTLVVAMSFCSLSHDDKMMP